MQGGLDHEVMLLCILDLADGCAETSATLGKPRGHWGKPVSKTSTNLPFLVGRFDLLFVGGHEAMSGDDALGDFGIIDLEKQRLLPRLWLSLLRHFVTGATDFDEFAQLDLDLIGETGM